MTSTTIEDRLAREARGGDQQALAKIFSEYHQPLYRYCLAIVGDRQDAEDALQETMVKALRSLPGEKREIALRPWLYRVAHNESIELLRRRRENVGLDGSEPTAGGGLAEQVETRERLRQLIADLEVLPERQRGVLLMREAAGLDFEESGAALDTSAAVARQTLYEARLGLREIDTGREMSCAAITRALSDGDRRVRRRRDISAHLRACPACRAFAEEIDNRRTDLAAIAPLPAVAAAALLHGVLAAGASGGAAVAGGASGGAAVAAGASGGAAGAGGSAGGAGGGAASVGGVGAGAGGSGAGLAAGTAVKSIGTATLLKGAAAVAVVAAIGVGAANQGGLIHLGKHGKTPTSPASQADGSSAGSAAAGATTDRSAARPEIAGGSKAARTPAQRSLAPARAAAPHPRRARPTDHIAASPADPGATESAEEPAATAPGNSGAAHPSGRDHEKQAPASAAHGQETAAANHTTHEAKEAPAAKGPAAHPEHPTHPDHPAHPTKPVGEADAPAAGEPPAPGEAPPEGASEHAATPPGQEK